PAFSRRRRLGEHLRGEGVGVTGAALALLNDSLPLTPREIPPSTIPARKFSSIAILVPFSYRPVPVIYLTVNWIARTSRAMTERMVRGRGSTRGNCSGASRTQNSSDPYG